jgi:hypothetical protein
MKDYIVGIAILAGVFIILAKVAIDQVKKVNEERQTMESAITNLGNSQNSSSIKNKQLIVQFGNDDVSKFMRENGATLQSMMEIGSINQRIGAESEAMRIPIQEQKTEGRAMRGREGTVLKVVNMHQYSLAVLTTFRESLVWLGKIEDSFPYARIENVTFTPSGDYVNLQARILFPRMDPSVISQ